MLVLDEMLEQVISSFYDPYTVLYLYFVVAI